MGKLKDVQLRNCVKAGGPLAMTDGDGLTFTLSASGTAAWVLRYYVAGKRKEMTLGRYPDIPLT
ncbi:partial Prophage integrase IntS, partial [Gammaproteobacteria bacterium]